MSALTIVTGASSNHFNCLTNLLYSISMFEAQTKAIVYDLGLKVKEVKAIKDQNYELRRFPFEDYPPYVNIAINCGSYAWKPIIIFNLLQEKGGMVLWLDAGNLIHHKLVEIRNVLTSCGVYSPISSGNIKKWTHPKTLEYLQAFKFITKANRNTAMVGFLTEYPGINKLVERWKLCALDRNCIAPKGANRSNHRWEQAILSILMYEYQAIYGSELEDRRLGISIHNDHLSRSEVCTKLRL
jgi:hypothetical protein